jgi:hypothetical protein
VHRNLPPNAVEAAFAVPNARIVRVVTNVWARRRKRSFQRRCHKRGAEQKSLESSGAGALRCNGFAEIVGERILAGDVAHASRFFVRLPRGDRNIHRLGSP